MLPVTKAVADIPLFLPEALKRAGSLDALRPYLHGGQIPAEHGGLYTYPEGKLRSGPGGTKPEWWALADKDRTGRVIFFPEAEVVFGSVVQEVVFAWAAGIKLDSVACDAIFPAATEPLPASPEPASLAPLPYHPRDWAPLQEPVLQLIALAGDPKDGLAASNRYLHNGPWRLGWVASDGATVTPTSRVDCARLTIINPAKGGVHIEPRREGGRWVWWRASLAGTTSPATPGESWSEPAARAGELEPAPAVEPEPALFTEPPPGPPPPAAPAAVNEEAEPAIADPAPAAGRPITDEDIARLPRKQALVLRIIRARFGVIPDKTVVPLPELYRAVNEAEVPGLEKATTISPSTIRRAIGLKK
jgi:hypothetical protein